MKKMKISGKAVIIFMTCLIMNMVLYVYFF